MLEASRTLGLGPWRGFFRVSLPLARPAVAAGATLALMETLADYGTVSYFGVQTFTTGIYRAWFSLGDRIAAAQLAAALLGFVILVLLIEWRSRGRARFHNTTGRHRQPGGRRLPGWRGWLATVACALPLSIGFLLPAYLLLRLALTDSDTPLWPTACHPGAQQPAARRSDGDHRRYPGGPPRLRRAPVERAAGARHSIAWSAWATPYPGR
jgi:iron(III) transport system permease protein